MQRLQRLQRKPELRVMMCGLFLALLSWPILSIADRTSVTSLFIYLFVVWGLLIVVMGWISAGLGDDESEAPVEE